MPYYYMMDWYPFMSIWMIVGGLIFVVIAYLVYKDAEKRGLNGLLWGLPILIPWIGILLLRPSGSRADGHTPASKDMLPFSSPPQG